MLRLAVLLCCALLSATPVLAKIDLREGLIQPEDIPKPINRASKVLLDVPQVWQGKDPWCVPASVSMVLAYYGEPVSPARLKALAESNKHQSQYNVWTTSWLDMQDGLKRMGERWKIKHFPNTQAGFQDGLRDIKRALRRGRPVLIDVDLLTGHTFVVVGYNDKEQLLYIRDPLLKDGRMRGLTYASVLKNWHNRGLAKTRSAFFSAP